MSLWSDIGKLRMVLAIRSRLQEAGKMGKLKTVGFALLGAILTGAVAQITGACPGLLSQGPAIAMAGLGGLVAYWTRKPLTNAAGKAMGTAVVTGAAAAAFAAIVAQVDTVCGAGFAHKIPSLAFAGVWVGFGLFLHAPHETPPRDLGSVKPTAPRY